MTKVIITLFFLLLPQIASTQEGIFGTYCRAYTFLDSYAKTVVTLNEDYTFEYKFEGHMIDLKYTGNFDYSDNDLLTFDYQSSEYADEIDPLELQIVPLKMVYRDNNLYEIDEDGNIIKSERIMSSRRRFILFGDYSIRKNVYLMKESSRNKC